MFNSDHVTTPQKLIQIGEWEGGGGDEIKVVERIAFFTRKQILISIIPCYP